MSEKKIDVFRFMRAAGQGAEAKAQAKHKQRLRFQLYGTEEADFHSTYTIKLLSLSVKRRRQTGERRALRSF